MKNQMILEFDALSENESFARIAVASFVIPYDPELEVLCDIKTAVSEAVTNAVVHAYRGRSDGKITIACDLEDGLLKIMVSDKGKGIDDIKKAMEPMYTEDESGERSGMGFTVMSVFMDSIDVSSTPNRGTDIYMTKHICNG